MDERRTLRISELVREELTEMVAFEMEDPRLLDAEITVVEVSPDSQYAKVKVALRGDERSQNQAIAALTGASGFLRRELASRLQLRLVPELRFEKDKNPDAMGRVDILLRRAKKSRGRD